MLTFLIVVVSFALGVVCWSKLARFALVRLAYRGKLPASLVELVKLSEERRLSDIAKQTRRRE